MYRQNLNNNKKNSYLYRLQSESVYISNSNLSKLIQPWTAQNLIIPEQITITSATVLSPDSRCDYSKIP